MHSYSIDSNDRTNIPFYIAVIGILCAWLLPKGVSFLHLSVPWWLDAPAAMGFYGLLYKFFDKKGWKWLSKLNLIQTPDLNGHWSGYFMSSYDNHTEKKAAQLEVKQTWNKICIVFKNDTSRSKSISASILTENGEGIVLSYEYQNEPGYYVVNTMQIHKGFTKLVLTDNQKLEGEYFTGRGRLNFGSMQFERD